MGVSGSLAAPALTTTGAGVNVTGSGALQVNGTAVVDSSRNLVNVGTVACGALTSSAAVACAGVNSSANVNVTGAGTFQVGGTAVLNSGRNLLNIGTVGCGAITSSGNL